MRTADGLTYQCEAAQVHMLLCKNALPPPLRPMKRYPRHVLTNYAKTPPILSIGIATCLRVWPGLPVPAA